MSSRSKSKRFKACRNCKALVDREVEVCPVCNGREFVEEWSGVVIVVDPENSEIAKTLKVNQRGRFVVKLE